MMFRRREPLSLMRRLREHVWPRAGFKRAFHYNVHRLKRIDDSSHGIAVGLACGVAVAFTPFLGAHFVLAMAIAWLIGGNIIAAALGTLVGNPWTFPFMFYWTYELGLKILGGMMEHHLPADLTLLYLIDHPWSFLLPMTVGGVPTAVVAGFVTYFPARALIERAQEMRRHRIAESSARRKSDAPRAHGSGKAKAS